MRRSRDQPRHERAALIQREGQEGRGERHRDQQPEDADRPRLPRTPIGGDRHVGPAVLHRCGVGRRVAVPAGLDGGSGMKPRRGVGLRIAYVARARRSEKRAPIPMRTNFPSRSSIWGWSSGASVPPNALRCAQRLSLHPPVRWTFAHVSNQTLPHGVRLRVRPRPGVLRRMGAAPVLLARPRTGARGATADQCEWSPGIPVAGQAHHDDDQLPRSECGGDGGRMARSPPGGGLPGNAVSGGGDGRAGGAAVALADGPEQDRRHRRGAAAADRLSQGSRRRGAPGVRVSGMSRRGEALRRRSGRVDRRDGGAFGRRRLEGAR